MALNAERKSSTTSPSGVHGCMRHFGYPGDVLLIGMLYPVMLNPQSWLMGDQLVIVPHVAWGLGLCQPGQKGPININTLFASNALLHDLPTLL
jgi:hypothetical protein